MYGEAAQIFQRCIQEHHGSFEAYYNITTLHWRTSPGKKWEEALATSQQSPQQSRAEVLDAHICGVRSKNRRERPAQRSPIFQMRLPVRHRIQPTAWILARFMFTSVPNLEAATVFERAAGYDSRSSFLVLGLARSRLLPGQHEQSIETVRKILSMQPDFALAQLLMTYALSAKGRLEDAEKVARQGLNSPRPCPHDGKHWFQNSPNAEECE
jgi:tetratricopeptide (TPR) repeat protein